jgi:single-strand DNA-binding protein
VNSVAIVGNVGQDPTVRKTSGGKSVANFSIAVSDGFGDQKKTYWIPIVVWDKTADLVSKYVGKGSQVAVEGRLQQRSWNDKGGNKHSAVEVVANRVDFLTKRASPQSEQEFDAPVADEDIPF